MNQEKIIERIKQKSPQEIWEYFECVEQLNELDTEVFEELKKKVLDGEYEIQRSDYPLKGVGLYIRNSQEVSNADRADCVVEWENTEEYQVFEKYYSTIFPEGEIKIFKQLLEGKKVVDEGTISGRIKPRIQEMLDIWLPMKKQLEKIVKPKEKKK